jgi:hypothetical protein
MASCAACASFFSLYVLGESGKYVGAVLLANVLAHLGDRLGATRVESVRM